MRTSLILLATLVLALVGCDTTSRTPTTTTPPPSTTSPPATAGTSDAPPYNSATPPGTSSDLAPASTDKPGTAGPSSAVEPDNTAVNERDADASTKTPIDQDETQRDVNITAEIRKAVLADEKMSVNARNVKIITAAGKVTLRGPVNSQEEKDAIESTAKAVAGKDNVTNEIDVKP
jgi:hyperosmotically inducible periplasmic protein